MDAKKHLTATGGAGGGRLGSVAPDLAGGFAERLYQQRRHLGWTQSELARRIWGSHKDGRGYTVARNRDRISAYEAKRAKPERSTLDRVADALGMTVEQLAPDILNEWAQKAGSPGVSMTMVAGRPNEVRLRIDLVTSLQVASEVIRLVNADPVANPAATTAPGHGL